MEAKPYRVRGISLDHDGKLYPEGSVVELALDPAWLVPRYLEPMPLEAFSPGAPPAPPVPPMAPAVPPVMDQSTQAQLSQAPPPPAPEGAGKPGEDSSAAPDNPPAAPLSEGVAQDAAASKEPAATRSRNRSS